MPEIELKLPAPALFMRGTVPEALTEVEREWLAEQLHAYPRRVNEENTCAISALTEMATTEFCRLMSERTRPTPDLGEDELVSSLRDLAPFLEAHHCSSASVIEAADRIEALEAEVARLKSCIWPDDTALSQVR